MIGRLKGTVAAITADNVILDVGGVGYEVIVVPYLLQKLNAGEALTLSIETIVREDFIRLYGFAHEMERQCFRLLISVQGVGAKHALNIQQVLPPAQLYDAVAMEDVGAICAAHGIGRKIGQRLVTELQSKMSALAGIAADGFVTNGAVNTNQPAPGDDIATNMSANPPSMAGVRADTVSALVNLGYDESQARRVVSQLTSEMGEVDVETLIPAALKQLATH